MIDEQKDLHNDGVVAPCLETKLTINEKEYKQLTYRVNWLEQNTVSWNGLFLYTLALTLITVVFKFWVW